MGKSSKKSMAPWQRVLDAANAVVDVMTDFAPFRAFRRNGLDALITNHHAAALDEATRERIVALFEANMKAMYVASDWGYDPDAKRTELFEEDARYLLAMQGEELLGFVHFRFVEDDGVEVMYIYEIQIAQTAQRKGLGKFLMQLLHLVARKHGMHFVMLTVFKTNDSAMRFYRETMGFTIDETSPSANGDKSQSYEILSKAVGGKR
ncbi:hypothetical protein Poli38472_014058 [Pythium oligandrum]|uniref:N-alpha-acetyltransferase 40 n=1 Tax=Pythium oligandrum TaxID=41045 RepID=A0A8K1CQA9_PYTOL|nr:hypothetical protein Poli38472_014058 [Pythium oligandrum]|eukprot:TMW66746.1 hypothetical protein Poli38472_014058 [Pythium oligandrum]